MPEPWSLTEARARAAAWLQAWDSQGPHRTGTEGDAAGADWLMREAAALGAEVRAESFALDRVDPVSAWLELDGTRIEGVPVFDAPSTDPDGLAGRLGEAGSDAAIGVSVLSPQSVYAGDYRRLRRKSAHRGLVIVTEGPKPGLALLNAEQFNAPYGVPAIQLASDSADALRAAVARHAPVRLVAHSRRLPAQAQNVVVTLPGRERTCRPWW